MPLRVKCICGARLKVPETSLGKSVRCGVCQKPIFIPNIRRTGTLQANDEIEAWIRTTCVCGKVVKAPADWAGKTGHCPRCGRDVLMPTAADAQKAAAAATTPHPVIVPQPGGAPGKAAGSLGGDAEDIGLAAADDTQGATVGPMGSGMGMATMDPSALEKLTDSIGDAPPQGNLAHKDLENAAIQSDPIEHDEAPSGNLSGLLDRSTTEPVPVVGGVTPELWEARVKERLEAKRKSKGSIADLKDYRLAAAVDNAKSVRSALLGVLLRNRLIVIVVCLLLLIASTSLVAYQILSGGSAMRWLERPRKVYFYDVSTKKLVVAGSDKLPPLDLGSGGKQPNGQPAGVRAYVFSCGDCKDEKQRIIGYLEQYTAEGRTALQNYRELLAAGKLNESAQAEEEANRGRQIATPEDDPLVWWAATSDAGQERLRQATQIRCPEGKPAMPCDAAP